MSIAFPSQGFWKQIWLMRFAVYASSHHFKLAVVYASANQSTVRNFQSRVFKTNISFVNENTLSLLNPIDNTANSAMKSCLFQTHLSANNEGRIRSFKCR